MAPNHSPSIISWLLTLELGKRARINFRDYPIMSQLNDGTAYTSDIALDGQAKNLTVTVQNTGYRKMD